MIQIQVNQKRKKQKMLAVYVAVCNKKIEPTRRGLRILTSAALVCYLVRIVKLFEDKTFSTMIVLLKI